MCSHARFLVYPTFYLISTIYAYTNAYYTKRCILYLSARYTVYVWENLVLGANFRSENGCIVKFHCVLHC